MKQGAVFGAALRFSQAGTAPRRENRPSARGTRSAFCKRASSRAAYLANGNPEPRSNFHKGALAARRENWLSARGKHTEARPADVAARCAWRSAPIFASARRGAPQKSAKRKRQAQRPRPVDETGSCVWRSAPVFASARRGAPQKSAKRKRNHPQIRISFNSRFPQVIIPSQPPFSQQEQGGLFFHTSLWYARVILWNPKRGYIPLWDKEGETNHHEVQ